jgi:hypothetical protein
MQLNSRSIHVAFILLMRSSHAAVRRSVRKHSRNSDEKEVSHGYEEVEEEEDVEVTLPARARSGACVGFVLREAQRSDLKSRPLLFFVSPNRPSRKYVAVILLGTVSLLKRYGLRDGAFAPQPLTPRLVP